MMDFAHWLPIIWAVILIAAISIYVVLDGFDLGIGMLFTLERNETRRNVMISTIAPARDGNETWMVLGSAMLYGVFPGAYATLLPAFYLPIVLMLAALPGATWLVWRTTGALEASCRHRAGRLAIGLFICIVAVSFRTPPLHAPYLRRWTEWPNILFVAPVPVFVIVPGSLLVASLRKGHTRVPFLCALGWFFLCLSGLGIAVWPWAVPPALTLWDVSSPPSSQLFQLVGTVILLPIILTYTIYSYRVFRGKVSEADGCH